MLKNLHRTKPGTSLLIALGLTTIIVLVSLGVTTIVVSSIRESANVTGANQAYYAAEGALEKGLLVNQDKGAGFSADTTAMDLVGIAPNSKQKASYTISGQVKADSKYEAGKIYGIPSPGTGNVGTDCDGLHPIIDGYFWYDPATKKFFNAQQNPMVEEYEAISHPCNWNKIKVGETVSIPLYVTDKDGNPVNIFTSDTQSFSLKVRTGCTDGSVICKVRPTLDYKNSGEAKYNYDDPVLTWQISGDAEDGSQSYVLGPIVNYDVPKDAWAPKTSIIFESRINDKKASSFEVFTAKQRGIDVTNCTGLIINFLTTNKSDASCNPQNWELQKIKKPVLKLTVIHSLQEKDADKIPYLEYQLISDSLVVAPTDTNQTITAEGFYGSFKQVLEVKNPQDASLLEYVIQQ